MAEAREIRKPFAFMGPGGDDEEGVFDFVPRPEPVPQEAEGDAGDPKDLSAPASAESSDLAPSAPTGRIAPPPSIPKPKTEAAPGLEDAERDNTPPKASEN